MVLVAVMGGEVMAAAPASATLEQAAPYVAVECIQFEGAHFRRDIAVKAV